MRRRRPTIISVVALAMSLAATPVVAPTGPVPVDAAAPVGASTATATVEAVAGLDALTVAAGERGDAPITVTPGTSWACVAADQSQTYAEARDDTTVQVRVDWQESGCADGVAFSFGRTSWEAAVQATIPTTVRAWVYEAGPAGWELVDSFVEGSASTTVEVSWQGTGSEQLTPWVNTPSICYTNPPSLCHVGGGAAVSRDAEVTATVQLGGLGVVAEVSAGADGTMHWWVQAGPVNVP